MPIEFLLPDPLDEWDILALKMICGAEWREASTIDRVRDAYDGDKDCEANIAFPNEVPAATGSGLNFLKPHLTRFGISMDHLRYNKPLQPSNANLVVSGEDELETVAAILRAVNNNEQVFQLIAPFMERLNPAWEADSPEHLAHCHKVLKRESDRLDSIAAGTPDELVADTHLQELRNRGELKRR